MDPSSSSSAASRTRLQKQAPAALHLQINPNAAPAAIPLLSPVSVAPPPLQFQPQQGQVTQVQVGGGWQHPAAAVSGSSEPNSQLISMFQNQCSIGDPAQRNGFGGAQARTFG